MKIVFVAFAVLLLISTIYAGRTEDPCAKQCPLDYDPICAGPEGTENTREQLSFGNECVMNKYNCEHKKNLIKLQAGECPGGKSVRLA